VGAVTPLVRVTATAGKRPSIDTATPPPLPDMERGAWLESDSIKRRLLSA